MPQGAKIATCCYCGSRAVLDLRGTTRHELACASCGAPLHALKRLREDRTGKPTRPARLPDAPPRPKSKARKRRKSPWQKALEEVVDAIEDIFD